MADIITQASLIILEGYDYALNRHLIKAREDFISIAYACIEKDLPVIENFEAELQARYDSGELGHTIYRILWWNMERILENYRRCFILKHHIMMKVLKKSQIGTEIECTICLEKCAKKEVLCIKSCQHEFCNGCLTEWLKLNKTCPLCRADASKVHGYIYSRGTIEEVN